MHPSNEIRSLTGLRFFAALYVLFLHSGSTRLVGLGLPAPLAHIAFNGYLGVSFFFVLSGFILTYVYWGRMDGRVSGFFKARAARIVPVYALALLICAVFFLRDANPSAVLAEIAFLQSWGFPSFSLGPGLNGVGWTLSVEFFFYLCFPFLLFLFHGLSRPAAMAGLVAMWALIAGLQLSHIAPESRDLAYPFLAYIPVPLLRLPEFVSAVSRRPFDQP